MPIKRFEDGKILGPDWNELVDLVELRTTLTNPPDGKYKITNLYVELIEGKPKLRVEYDDGEPE